MAIIDLHTHTSRSSGCARMTARQLIEAAVGAGLDGVAVTEHFVMEGAEEAQALARLEYGLPVFRGVEARTAGMGDVLVFGCYRDFPPNIPWPDLRHVVLAEGGVLIPAHPFRRRDPNSLWALLEARGARLGSAAAIAALDGELDGLLGGVTAIEVANSANEPGENDEAAALARLLALPACGGSDAHWIDRVGRSATSFREPIATDAELVACLKEGQYRPVWPRNAGTSKRP